MNWEALPGIVEAQTQVSASGAAGISLQAALLQKNSSHRQNGDAFETVATTKDQ
jgi:hypothetical protein